MASALEEAVAPDRMAAPVPQLGEVVHHQVWAVRKLAWVGRCRLRSKEQLPHDFGSPFDAQSPAPPPKFCRDASDVEMI